MWRGVRDDWSAGDEYDLNTLYICKKFPKNKLK